MIDILRELSDMKLNDVLKQLKENLLAISRAAQRNFGARAILNFRGPIPVKKFLVVVMYKCNLSVKFLTKFNTLNNENIENCSVLAVAGNLDHTFEKV